VQALWRGYLSALRFATGGLLLVVVTTTFLNVGRRYLGFGTFPWADETARRLLLWMTFLGAALAVANRAHLRIDTLGEFIPDRVMRVINVVVGVLAVGFFMFLIVGGYDHMVGNVGRRTPGMGVSAAWSNAAVPVGGILMLLSFIGSATFGRGDRGAEDEAPPDVDPNKGIAKAVGSAESSDAGDDVAVEPRED